MQPEPGQECDFAIHWALMLLLMCNEYEGSGELEAFALLLW